MTLCGLSFATCKVGGIRFVRIGRLAVSICIVRASRAPRRPQRRPAPAVITLVPSRDYVVEVRLCE